MSHYDLSFTYSDSKNFEEWRFGSEYSIAGADTLSAEDMMDIRGKESDLPQCGARSDSYGYMTTKRKILIIDNYLVLA